jgi:hypothetical protein
MTGKEALGVFTRTFLVLAGAVLVAVQGLEWADSSLIGNNALTLGLGLLSAALGGLGAVAAAYLIHPSASKIEKAIRAFIEKILAGGIVVTFSSAADLVAFGKLLPALLIAAVFSFVITYVSVEPPPVPPGAATG